MANLPLHPNLGFYRKQAKQLRRAHAQGDGAAAARLRARDPSLAGQGDAELLARPFSLGDAQRLIAREHGFPSWTRFRAAVLEAAEDPALTPEERLVGCIRVGDLEGARELLEARPDLARAPATQGSVPLVEACDRGDVELARLLLAHGADPAVGDAWRTPLLAAAHSGPHKRGPSFALIDLLREHGLPDDLFLYSAVGDCERMRERLPGTQIDAVGPAACTALFLATWKGHPEAVRMLLDAGADPEVRCRADAKTAYEVARLHLWSPPHHAIARLLVERGAFCSLHDACELGHLPTVERIVQSDPAAASARSPDGFAPLDLALFRGERDVTRALLAAGAPDPEGRAQSFVEGRDVQDSSYAGTRFRRSNLHHAMFDDVNLGGATFHNVNLGGAQLDNVNLADVRIRSGNIRGLSIYGIDVAPLVEAELERRRGAD